VRFERLRSIFTRARDRPAQLVRSTVANETAHGVVRDHDLGTRTQAATVPQGQQPHSDDRPKRVGKTHPRALLLVGRKESDNTIDGLRRLGRRVQRRKHDVSCFCRLQACGDRFDPAQFSDKQYVRVGAHRPAHTFSEAADVASDLVLGYDPFEPSVLVLDRIGHELRTPLTSILGFLETLMDNELDASTARRFLEVAREEALRLGRLVEGMFELSLLDLRREDGRGESASLAAALDAACNALAPFAAARGCKLERTPFVDVEVALGADRITQITLNLLENAVKHGRAAGTVGLGVAVLDARYVEIRVSDDGPGVPPPERERVFSLGHRGKDARAPGSGLGLALVRLMVERFGGEVDVTQSAAGGALFRVRLPHTSGSSLVAASRP